MALILVTGASTGLGLAAARELAANGHDVVVHARRADRFAGEPDLGAFRDTVFADLAEQDQVVGLARRLNDLGRFDAVIHNAGVVSGPSVFAVNLVAPYLLSGLLTPPRRVIVLSSSMHATGSADLAGLYLSRPDRRRRPYDDSKLYATALAMALADRLPNALVHAVDPGWVPTRMGGPSAPDDLTEGHRTQTWLATADPASIEPRTGGYWFHRRSRRPHPVARDPGFQSRLLRLLHTHTGIGLQP